MFKHSYFLLLGASQTITNAVTTQAINCDHAINDPVLTVTCTDADDATVAFSFASPSTVFAIDATTGNHVHYMFCTLYMLYHV